MTDDKTSILCELIGHSWCSSLGCDVCHVCGAVQKVTSPNYTVIKLPMRSEGVKMGKRFIGVEIDERQGKRQAAPRN